MCFYIYFVFVFLYVYIFLKKKQYEIEWVRRQEGPGEVEGGEIME